MPISMLALIGFQGRGCARASNPIVVHPFLLEVLLVQWPSIRRCASRTMVEHKTPESNKSDLSLPLPWQSRCPLVYKKSFFVIAPFSHHTPRSNFIEERQAMRYI